MTAAGVRAKLLLVDDRKENLVALEAILQGLPVDS
ncbi:MAG: response regulator, partial [Micromonosporaceae bacterium]